MCEVLRNKHYQDDIKTSLQITRDFLLAVGIWPIEKRSLCEKIDRYLRILVSYIFLYCALVPGALYWMIEKRTRVRLRSTTILLYGFITIIKYYNLITHEAQIRRCLKFFEEDWKSVDNTAARNIMLESASIGKRMVTICAIFMYSSGLSLRILIPLSKGKIVTPQNVTIRPLPYPTYLFSFDVQPTPIYEIVFTMHVFTGIITVSISMCIYSLMIVFIMHICGQLKILINLIKDLAEKQQRDELEVNKKLGAIVEHQTRTRRCVCNQQIVFYFFIFMCDCHSNIMLLTSTFQLFAISGEHSSKYAFYRDTSAHSNSWSYKLLHINGL